jgi:hypothetical protein
VSEWLVWIPSWAVICAGLLEAHHNIAVDKSMYQRVELLT